MTKVKTADLIGPALDWAVAKADGVDVEIRTYHHYIGGGQYHGMEVNDDLDEYGNRIEWRPSTDWSQGGPLIEQHTIGVDLERHGLWVATPQNWTENTIQYGCTPLIAACRAIVAAKLGDEVEIPDELFTPSAQ